MIIDVGANKGSFALDIAKLNPSEFVLAIEPINELSLGIKELAQEMRLTNVFVVDCAIDEVERHDYINVAEHHDWGVSSLLSFDESKVKGDEYWSNRSDLYFDRKQSVVVKRLDSLLTELLSVNDKINFIKVDAQGLDLNVLKSLGSYLNVLQAGMIEVSVTRDFGLYESENYDLSVALNWLDDHGFKPYFLKPNDPASNEFNLYFCRKDIIGLDVERSLSLREVDLYSSKFYWHLPSRNLEVYEEKVQHYEELKESLSNANAEVNRLNELLNDANNCIESFKKSLYFRLVKKVSLFWRDL